MEMKYLESGCSGHSKRARIVPGRKDGESHVSGYLLFLLQWQRSGHKEWL